MEMVYKNSFALAHQSCMCPMTHNVSVLAFVAEFEKRQPELLLIAAQLLMFIPSAPLAQNPLLAVVILH
jgi:hypothetical protein